jgi:sigma-B regulation protein RsbU (phosphoserine phosphatase)
MKRILEALNEDPNASPEQVLGNVRKAVDGFVKSEEQFDDLTMLCMEYKGPGPKEMIDLEGIDTAGAD